MLSLLKIKNIALIDEIGLEFASGLNLLTGETGSGKSIIVDSLGALTGERVSSDLIKEGETSARIEGLFNVSAGKDLRRIFDESGVELDEGGEVDLIVRRELSATGKNRIFVNNQLVTQNFLKKIGAYLVDIHGQGEQATLFNAATHLEMLDEYAGLENLREQVAGKYRAMREIRREIENLQSDEAQKLQLIDVLQFQVDEIRRVNLQPGEDEAMEEEKRRLNNVEKLSSLSDESYSMLYENEESTVTTLEKVVRRINELAEYESSFRDYAEGLQTAQAVLEDLAFAVRDFRGSLEFSPERLEEIENRLAEISRLKRKYGGAIETILAHFDEAEERLKNIETAEMREEELRRELKKAREDYLKIARELHEKRERAARKFEKETEASLKMVALEKARFEVRIDAPDFADEAADKSFTAKGFDRIEFYFSANPGESVKSIAKVASGGELSRLMLILNTTAKFSEHKKAMVFDEIDTGIGGRVAEAVGLKLKELAKTQQVLCVTHQPQVASLADHHFFVQKEAVKNRTEIRVKELGKNEKVEEIARMLTGAEITETARQHAKEMLAKN
ncbi:MAG TPA: DNA repair protein RecN [Pyrinomonadaceae bacterium]|jgi:DNA repair protein RecN (Recombination protein N)